MRLFPVIISYILLLGMTLITVQAAIYTLSPAEVWEGSTTTFSLRVNNYLQTPAITDIQVLANGFTITQIQDYKAWQENAAGSIAHWSSGSINDEVEVARFDYTAKAPSGIIGQTIQNIDVTGNDGTTTLRVTVKEDLTGPLFLLTLPFDGSYFREGILNQQVSAEVEDPETGVEQASFSYRFCSSNSSTTVALIQNATEVLLWENRVDLSAFKQGDELCFTFRAKNHAGKETRLEGKAGFDNTPPTVLLYVPANGSVISEKTKFTYSCIDNIAQELTYTFSVDNNDLFGGSINNRENLTVDMSAANMTEGLHAIGLSCTDGVGLSARIQRTYTMDKTPPEISLTNPFAPNIFIADNQLITAIATDAHGGQVTAYSVDRNTGTHPEGPLSFTVTAQDQPGNEITSPFTIIIDKTAPTLTVLSPPENGDSPQERGESDGKINLTLVDNFMNQSGFCTITSTTGESANGTFTMGSIAEIVVPGIPLGPTTLTIICNDQADNRVQERIIVDIVDRSGPFIRTITTYLVRSQDNTVKTEIIDVSGVDSARVTLFATNKAMQHTTGDEYTTLINPSVTLPLGTYNMTITATDVLGYENTLVTPVELIIGYDFDLKIIPATALPGEIISIEGRITYDNGSLIPERNATLTLYNGTRVVVVLSSTGDFAYLTVAPATLGRYTNTLVLASQNGYLYTEMVEGEVATQNNPGGTGSGNSGGRRASGSSSVGKSEGSSSTSSESSAAPSSSSESDSKASSSSTESSSSSSPSQESGEEGENAIRSGSTSPVGVGRASGIFNLAFLKSKWWVLLLLVATIAGLAALSYYQKGDEAIKKP